jgi:uroporphyrinogen III methyltransferase/synthase
VAEPGVSGAIDSALSADYVTFTSASSVRFFLQASEGHGRISASTRIVSIGPITSEALRERSLEPDVEAERHDVDGLIEALLADASALTAAG